MMSRAAVSERLEPLEPSMGDDGAVAQRSGNLGFGWIHLLGRRADRYKARQAKGGRGLDMRAIVGFALLMVSCALPIDGAGAATLEACSNKCADQRDQCKVKACAKAGGHTQLHQGTCYNLPLQSKQSYAAALTQCTAKLQACSNKCQ